MTSPCKVALLLIAHGSKRQAANNDLVTLAEMLRDKNIFDQIEIAYLEVVEPTIPQGACACIEQGATEVLMFPYFLSAGNHVQHDLEQHRLQLANEYRHVRFTLCPPLGLHPLMIDIVCDRIAEGRK